MLDAEPFQVACKLECWAVRVIHEEDMVARFQQAHDDCADCGHSGSESLAGLSMFQCREFFLEHFDCGILSPCVNCIRALSGTRGEQ